MCTVGTVWGRQTARTRSSSSSHSCDDCHPLPNNNSFHWRLCRCISLSAHFHHKLHTYKTSMTVFKSNKWQNDVNLKASEKNNFQCKRVFTCKRHTKTPTSLHTRVFASIAQLYVFNCLHKVSPSLSEHLTPGTSVCEQMRMFWMDAGLWMRHRWTLQLVALVSALCEVMAPPSNDCINQCCYGEGFAYEYLVSYLIRRCRLVNDVTWLH